MDRTTENYCFKPPINFRQIIFKKSDEVQAENLEIGEISYRIYKI